MAQQLHDFAGRIEPRADAFDRFEPGQRALDRGSMASRGWSETTCTLTQVSIETVANSCLLRTCTAGDTSALGSFGERLRHRPFERLRAVGGAADDIDLRALALDDL